MKRCIAAMLLLFCGVCYSQMTPDGRPRTQTAYPELEAAAAWRGLAAGYVRKALKDHTLDEDPTLNARIDAVMAAVGAAVAVIDTRFADSAWKAILITDFGYGAAAFPGEIILVDAKFVRTLQLNDDELALILAHEAAHVVAGHASIKLAFMAEFLGKEKVPTARTPLLQEREADRLGAALFYATGYDTQRALRIFDKLVELERCEHGQVADSHDAATTRKLAFCGVIADLQQFQAGRGPEPR